MQTGEACTPHYSAKKRPTADPKLNPEPATKLTERLVVDNMHGHAPIRSRSVNPELTVALLGEIRLLVTTGPLVVPSKGEQNGEG